MWFHHDLEYGGEVDEKKRVWRILSCMSTLCDVRSLIIWMMGGIAERETVRQAMRQMTTPLPQVT
jgi:hypothetical protein